MFVTDTHALVHHVTGRKNKLGRAARRIFDSLRRGAETILIPFTALEEVMLLCEVGRIKLPMPFRDFVISLTQSDGFDLGVNDAQLLLEAASFRTIVDPYDRLIVAQARVTGAPLITGDNEIHESGLVRIVWD
jgi:PIN domain nuclease of toxin-antitoxin system